MAPVLEVRRDDLRTAWVLYAETSPLEPSQTRFAAERFGLTANNVTYGLLGDTLRYWTFFPGRRVRVGPRSGLGLRHRSGEPLS